MVAEQEEEEEAAGPDPAQQQRLAPIEPGGAPLGRGAVARSGWPQRPLLVPIEQLLFSSRGSPPQGLWVPAWGQDPYFSPSPWLRLGPHKLGARSKDRQPRGDTPSPRDTPRGLMQQLQGWLRAGAPRFAPMGSLQVLGELPRRCAGRCSWRKGADGSGGCLGTSCSKVLVALWVWFAGNVKQPGLVRPLKQPLRPCGLQPFPPALSGLWR